MSTRVLTFDILRYNPDTDEAPYLQPFTVDCPEEWVVLDALNAIKDHQDPTLAYRWSCHMAVCGSCGMMVNGEPVLACKAFLRDYGDRIRVEPLAHFPIEKDLVVVLDGFIDRITRVKPWLIAREPRQPEDGPGRQSPRDLKRFKQYTLCINCSLCYAACPQTGLLDDFLGPAALALAHRYNQDSRDAGRDQREEITAADNGVWSCSFVGACSEVCPKEVDPAGAIQQMKINSTLDWYKEHLLPRRGK